MRRSDGPNPLLGDRLCPTTLHSFPAVALNIRLTIAQWLSNDEKSSTYQKPA